MGSKYGKIREGSVIKKVTRDWFADFDCTDEVGNIDFAVAVPIDLPLFEEQDANKKEYLLWAEVKKGMKQDINESFVQLILTIGKARTYEQFSPPPFLGAFDAEKIAFISYADIADVFYEGDFNWNVTPSDHTTKEFQQLHKLVEQKLNKKRTYSYVEDAKGLRSFIKTHFKVGNNGISPILITNRNFIYVYQKWVHEVMPSIDIPWDVVRRSGLLPIDFYLADLLSKDNITEQADLFVLLKKTRYVYDVREEMGGESVIIKGFNDEQKAHTNFWSNYKRPPEKMYQDKIMKRRDLLVPNEMRVRKGAFYTPQKWVKLSQKYLERELGENWQNEYYVWDCCAGTGNLLEGLKNKNNVFASTLYKQDVKIMRQRIGAEKLNLWENHVFQFDFLNDKFGDTEDFPKDLLEIINNEEKRKKLVIYINPPYAEAGDIKQTAGTGKNKDGVSKDNKTYEKYRTKIGKASNELFAQFLIRMYSELEGCIIANFSTLKILTGTNFKKFRNIFKARLGQLFIVPANTFDNVQGDFPIGFFVWHTSEEDVFNTIIANVYDKKASCIDSKQFYSTDRDKLLIGKWLIKYSANNDDNFIGCLNSGRNDFQNQDIVYIANWINAKTSHAAVFHFTQHNLIIGCVYFAVRHCIEHTWINHNDQFVEPNDTWRMDDEFKSNCLVYTLFHEKNCIKSKGGKNYWIPFKEGEVGINSKFDSQFMAHFISGTNEGGNRIGSMESKAIRFSVEAQAVLDAGRELWRYYHQQPKANINASFYDIRKHFQGVDKDGKMNSESTDAEYMVRINHLRRCMKVLAEKIAPKVYEHGFLMGPADESMR